MIIIDSSVAFKWLKSKDEPYHEKAKILLERHITGGVRIAAPSLLFIEIANALATKTSTNPKTIRTNLNALYSFDLEIYRENQDDLVASSLLARKRKTSVYDMLYAMLAKRLGIELITADEQFVRKTNFFHVRPLSEYVV